MKAATSKAPTRRNRPSPEPRLAALVEQTAARLMNTDPGKLFEALIFTPLTEGGDSGIEPIYNALMRAKGLKAEDADGLQAAIEDQFDKVAIDERTRKLWNDFIDAKTSVSTYREEAYFLLGHHCGLKRAGR